MTIQIATPQGVVERDLTTVLDELAIRRAVPSQWSVAQLIDVCDDFGKRLLEDSVTQRWDGIAFLSSWLRRTNLLKTLRINFQGQPEFLDGFRPCENAQLAAKPRGIVSMWIAGNVATLPLFSLVSGLLTKNVCLVKVPHAAALVPVLGVWAQASGQDIRGTDLLPNMAFVEFDHRREDLSQAMALAADAQLIWGGTDAVRGIRALPKQDHCVEIVFGPKYSVGVIDATLQQDHRALDRSIAAFVRDIAMFDQRACSSPQTIFVETGDRATLRRIAEVFARHFELLGPKADVDAFTTMQILNCRAAWALDGERDVIASRDGANWTVCIDQDVSLKEAVQSRTVFLTGVESWSEILPLLGPRIQTAGIAFGDEQLAMQFAGAATERGVDRCVRPGLMNGYESPWDGKLPLSELVRWVTLKA